MIGRIALIGVGYVLGARAGRERYESIAQAAAQLAGRLDTYAQDRGVTLPSARDVPPSSST